MKPEEICQCGHKKTDHGSLIRHGVRIGCAGNCCTLNCDCTCQRFRWAGWANKPEKELVKK